MNATTHRNDPLLVAGKVLIILIIVVLIFGLVMLGIGIGALLTVGRGDVFDRIAAANAPDTAYWVVIGAFALLWIAIALAARFFDTLYRIIASVDDGEPFDPANARRLRKMGWLSLGVQLVLIPIGMLTSWLAPYLERLDETVAVDFGIDPATLLLVVVLFILARVFERGADMRQDLEGTV